MKVTQVALMPSAASTAAQRPVLTPELLAASGARYSRNNQGLDAILERIDPANLDASVDSIFRLIDYGHQSIADMVPVAMFMDDLSLWLAYYVWTLCPTAGGQESSTRYIQLRDDGAPAPDHFGIPAARQAGFRKAVQLSFQCYAAALEAWDAIGTAVPQLTAIPAVLRDDRTDRGQRAVERMRRNFKYDRARYYLPMSASTNMMLVMSARGWITLCQVLCSHPLPEAQALGDAVRSELALTAPRLLKHATAKPGMREGLRAEFEALQQEARAGLPAALEPDAPDLPAAADVALQVMPPPGCDRDALAKDLAWHDNRYAWIGPHLRRVSVRVAWSAMAMAEIRDLNRHRTGNKYCPLRPVGFYAALEQLPDSPQTRADAGRIRALHQHGRALSAQAHRLLADGDPTYVYGTLLGTQFPFEHVTTADKFIYEAELRTGLGAHFRYARHLKDALEVWYREFPSTREFVLEGNAEPE